MQIKRITITAVLNNNFVAEHGKTTYYCRTTFGHRDFGAVQKVRHAILDQF